MTLSERIDAAAARRGITRCDICDTRHSGAAWSPGAGWHDAETVRQSAVPLSPFTRRAIARQLPAAETGR